MPTIPPQPDTFLPLLETINPSLLQQLRQGILGQRSQTTFTTGGGSSSQGKIPGVPGKDYPDFKTIPNTEFSCENFILEGFYADTFTSCQVIYENREWSTIILYLIKYIYFWLSYITYPHLFRCFMFVSLENASLLSSVHVELFLIKSTEFAIGVTTLNVKIPRSSMT